MPSSNTTHDSYVICQQEWYHVQVIKQGSRISMVVNEAFEVTDEIVDGDDMMGSLSLGQLTGNSWYCLGYPTYSCKKKLGID